MVARLSLFTAEQYPFVWSEGQSVQGPVAELLYCVPFLTFVSNTAMSVDVQIFMWTYVSLSLG